MTILPTILFLVSLGFISFCAVDAGGYIQKKKYKEAGFSISLIIIYVLVALASLGLMFGSLFLSN